MDGSIDLLAIPDFLDARKRPARACAAKPGNGLSRRERWAADPVLPEGEWTAFEVGLQDELPTIGCGYRVVFARVGRVWVRVYSQCGHHRARVRRTKWERLGPIDLGWTVRGSVSDDEGEADAPAAACGAGEQLALL